ncbi:hypothetical protein [Streptomyces palmae]|uniref:Uncharacterized protein n=1 Tax=Streptomyces palmae TaxID=1701085 RepID=A0A4Z0HER7_9ACTN|nr:hypothetical protein [Streptomyces palmae]TGB14608.1 hypothetical protein E4099_08215 [Streptomyces palmae]
MTAVITLGGVAAGGSLLVFTLARWARTGRRLDRMILLAIGLGMGLLAAGCSGGLLAWITAHTAGPANAVGRVLIGGADQAVADVHRDELAVGGGVAITVLLAAALLLARFCCTDLRWHLAIGALSGDLLGRTPGVSALVADTLTPAVNSLGEHILNSLN